MKRYKYPKVRSGEWVQPVLRGYRMKCCGCGLVHVMDFCVIHGRKRHVIQFRAWRSGEKRP